MEDKIRKAIKEQIKNLKEGFRDPEDNYGFGDVKYEIDDYAIGDEVIVVKGGERMVISKTGSINAKVNANVANINATNKNAANVKANNANL